MVWLHMHTRRIAIFRKIWNTCLCTSPSCDILWLILIVSLITAVMIKFVRSLVLTAVIQLREVTFCLAVSHFLLAVSWAWIFYYHQRLMLLNKGEHNVIHCVFVALMTGTAQSCIMSRHCAVMGCTNGIKLARWQAYICPLHDCNRGCNHCVCEPPFRYDFFLF